MSFVLPRLCGQELAGDHVWDRSKGQDKEYTWIRSWGLAFDGERKFGLGLQKLVSGNISNRSVDDDERIDGFAKEK